ncbi:hypothetical protein [Sphingobacterium thalpophilum]|uniref:hypothetical protein n=1 Tax=Sphingobacterium thalpophilum TaxID=259 RepID=UPI0024A71D2A|nr:hypothetical protein [Sphingobacterium thalpophilum]
MRNKNLILSVLLIIICKFGFSQMIRLESVSYSYVQVVNNEVLLNYGAPTTMRVSVMLSKPVQDPWGSLPVKGEVKLYYYKDNQEVNILDPITFTGADWSLPAFSNFIVKNITIPANTVTITNPKIQVFAKWRYYKEGYPNPDNNNGWTDWYGGGYTNFVLNSSTLPETTFTGPSQICDEATYTIENPGTITLENATGIATLTSLGNNQWKVTRIGSSTGTVQLVSSISDKKFSKSIAVGTLPPTISGPQNVTSNNSYYYTVYKNNPNSTLNIDAYAGPGMPYTLSVVGNQITLNTNSIEGNVRDYSIQLKATETNSCGTSKQTVFSVRFRGGDGPIN